MLALMDILSIGAWPVVMATGMSAVSYRQWPAVHVRVDSCSSESISYGDQEQQLSFHLF